VLLKPPVEPATWGLWFGPAALLLLGGGGIALHLRRRRRAEPAPLSAAEQARLEALLGASEAPDRS
jgi:cytochrome c-type biogenesis protein CcmH